MDVGDSPRKEEVYLQELDFSAGGLDHLWNGIQEKHLLNGSFFHASVSSTNVNTA